MQTRHHPGVCPVCIINGRDLYMSGKVKEFIGCLIIDNLIDYMSCHLNLYVKADIHRFLDAHKLYHVSELFIDIYQMRFLVWLILPLGSSLLLVVKSPELESCWNNGIEVWFSPSGVHKFAAIASETWIISSGRSRSLLREYLFLYIFYLINLLFILKFNIWFRIA